MRRMPHHQKRDSLTSTHRELRLCREPPAFCGDVGPERERVRPTDGAEVAIDLSYPRHDRSVVETDDQFHVHPYLAAESLDDAYEIRFAVARCHEVDDSHVTGISCEVGLENQRVGAIPASGGDDFRVGTNQPATVLRRAEQRREAGAGVEVRQAQPINGAVAPDKRRGLRVADEAVIFDAERHERARPLASS